MNDPITEASEIVAAIAGMDPIDDDYGLPSCRYCDEVEFDGGPHTHKPDCVWIRARRLARLPVHPHKVRST